MTKQTEALKLALEALENHPGNYKLSKAECAEYGAVEDALREALALVNEVDQEPPPQQQDPVAWMIWTHGPVLVFMNKDEANLEFDRLNHTYPAPTRMLVPLYTSPQAQRKPLTDEQVKAGLIQSIEYTDARERCAFNIGVRFAERAHGIK